MLIRAILAAAALLCASPAAASDRVDAAIVFVMDVSASMSRLEVDFARESHGAAIASEPMVSGILDGAAGRVAVAYVEFASSAAVRIGWTVIDGPQSALAVGASFLDLPRDTLGNATNLGPGLLLAEGLLDALPYRAEKLVVDIVGDGRAYDMVEITVARDAILSRGATINALPLMVAPSTDLPGFYEGVIGGPAHFLMPVTAIEQLPQALRSKIVLELF